MTIERDRLRKAFASIRSGVRPTGVAGHQPVESSEAAAEATTNPADDSTVVAGHTRPETESMAPGPAPVAPPAAPSDDATSGSSIVPLPIDEDEVLALDGDVWLVDPARPSRPIAASDDAVASVPANDDAGRAEGLSSDMPSDANANAGDSVVPGTLESELSITLPEMPMFVEPEPVRTNDASDRDRSQAVSLPALPKHLRVSDDDDSSDDSTGERLASDELGVPQELDAVRAETGDREPAAPLPERGSVETAPPVGAQAHDGAVVPSLEPVDVPNELRVQDDAHPQAMLDVPNSDNADDVGILVDARDDASPRSEAPAEGSDEAPLGATSQAVLTPGEANLAATRRAPDDPSGSAAVGEALPNDRPFFLPLPDLPSDDDGVDFWEAAGSQVRAAIPALGRDPDEIMRLVRRDLAYRAGATDSVPSTLAAPEPPRPESLWRLLRNVAWTQLPRAIGWTWVRPVVLTALGVVIVGLVLSAVGLGPRRSVRLRVVNPGAQFVYVVGDFNHWNPTRTPMTRTPGGVWEATVHVRPGRYRYRFLADGDAYIRTGDPPGVLDSELGEGVGVLYVPSSGAQVTIEQLAPQGDRDARGGAR